jgi:hypothetical protein
MEALGASGNKIEGMRDLYVTNSAWCHAVKALSSISMAIVEIGCLDHGDLQKKITALIVNVV